MGLYGRYARVTAAELDKALQDTKSAQDLRDRIFHSFYPDEGEVPPFSRDHLLNIDKAWDGLRYLLAAEGQAPVDPVLGGTPVSDDGQGGDSERYLTPSEVKEVAAYLRATPWERLASFFDPDTMMAARIYPEVWDRDHEDPIGYLRAYRDRLVAFFSAAAQAGDVVLLWIS